MDKARRLYPLAIKFADGEQPSSTKLTGISTQAKNALGIVEFMLGDIWNQAGDAILSPGGTPTINALHIPNIARSIGRMSLLNSMLPGTTPLSSSMLYVDDIGTLYAGQNQALLKYKPVLTPSVSNMILGGTFAPLVQLSFVANPVDVIASGQWSITSEGKMYSFDPIPSTLTLQYTPLVISDISDLTGASAAWNVIPDPSTWSGNYSGVKISFANNTDTTLGYHIWLPPRKALTSSKLIRQSPTVTNNTTATPDAGNILFFQDPASNASITNANHYRYNFPNEIVTVGVSGDAIPTGFIYLWDETTGTIIDGATFFVPGAIGDRKFKIRATGTNLVAVFGNAIGNGIITDDTTQLPADYISRFKIITVGASLSKTLSYLNKNFWNHKHKTTEGHAAVSHSDLSNLVTPSWDLVTNPIYPSGVLAFRKSSWQNDDHSQYLHRAGSTMSLSNERDRSDNAMLRMFTVKSPNQGISPLQGRVNLSVTDDGQTANLTATTFTTLNIGPGTGLINGDSGGIVNLDGVQINQRLYLGDIGGAPPTTLSDDYLAWHESLNELDLIADGSLALSTFVAGTVRGLSVIGDGTVRSVTDMTVGGDITSTMPAGREGSYKYLSSRYQYLSIQPEEMNISVLNTADGLAFDFTQGGIVNNSTANTSVLYVPIHLPNGAILSTSESATFFASGNGTNAIHVTLFHAPKPTADNWSSVTASSIIFDTALNISANNKITNLPYTNTSTVDTSFTGNWWTMLLSFPVKISSNAPKLWNITLQYRMPQVDN